jgi:hypothetical protein
LKKKERKKPLNLIGMHEEAKDFKQATLKCFHRKWGSDGFLFCETTAGDVGTWFNSQTG